MTQDKDTFVEGKVREMDKNYGFDESDGTRTIISGNGMQDIPIEDFLRTILSEAIEFGAAEERKRILGLLPETHEWSPLPHNTLRAQGWNLALKEIRARISSE